MCTLVLNEMCCKRLRVNSTSDSKLGSYVSVIIFNNNNKKKKKKKKKKNKRHYTPRRPDISSDFRNSHSDV